MLACCSPWETDDPGLIGVSVGLSEVGCLIGATVLSIFPTHRRRVHVLLFLIGLSGCIIGIFAIDFHHIQEKLLLMAFTFIGIATSIQPITAIVPVKDELQTVFNANAYAMCRQLSYATTLVFATTYSYFGWRYMCVMTIFLFVAASGLTWIVGHISEDGKLVEGTTPTPIREAIRILPKFVFVILIAFSASGFTEGINNSMSVLILKEVWITAKDTAFQRTMTCPLIAVAVYPFLAYYLTYRIQFLLAMFLLGVFIVLYPLMPNAWLGFFMLIFWNIGKTCMHASVYSVIREATDDTSVIARLVTIEQWTCTLFYGLAGLLGGPLYNLAFWVPFVVAGAFQAVNLVASFFAFIMHDTGNPTGVNNWIKSLSKSVPRSEDHSYLILD